VTVLAGVDPVVAAISPPNTPQGAVTQDVYVNAQAPSNFFSTSVVVANGQPVPTTFINTELIRGSVPAALLQSPGQLQIAVERQNGDTSNAIAMQVIPQRPAIVSYSPVSVPQCATGSCGPAAVTLDGGYFSPSTTVQFNGLSIGAKLNDPNHISVSVPATALQTAGLYQLAMKNPGATQTESAVNVAVEPALSSNPASVVATAAVGTNPGAVAVDQANGMAVVANTGSNSISLVDLTACSGGTCPAATTVAVGNKPTGVAVDSLHDLAIVVNQGDKTLSIVDLASKTVKETVTLPSSFVPFSVGENPITEHALVANQETNTVTVVDLSKSPAAVSTVDVTQGGTRPGGTGIRPQVQVVPRLDWAIVTPGGAGAITAIDMSHQSVDPSTGITSYSVVFSFTLSTTVSGIALNPVTDQILLTDPNSTSMWIMNLLDESVKTIAGTIYNNVAATMSPLTNVGLVVNQQTNAVQLVDMGSAQPIGSPLTVGNAPVAAALDQVTNQAVVVNQGDGTVSVVSLGAVRSLSVLQAGASRLFTSSAAQSLTLLGGGFQAGAVVRNDGTALPSANVQMVSDREVQVTLPASLLSGPRLLNLDVQNPDSSVSNVFQVPVVQAVTVGSSPVAVAVDPGLNLAVVTNSGSNTVSLVDLGTGKVTATVNVGESPQAVAVIPRLGTAVVADTNDNTAALVNLTTPAANVIQLSSTQGPAVGPIAVDIDQDTAIASIANQQTNNLTMISSDSGTISSSVSVDQGPLGVSVDPALGFAAVLCSTQTPPTIDILNTQQPAAFLTAHLTGATLPIGVTLDPVNNWFLVADSTGNRVLVVDPQNSKFVQNIATGINPTSIAYNFQALEAVTVNTASHTASVIEISPTGSQVRALFQVDGSSQQSVAIDPLTNLILVADQANNRLLLVPAPH
jgi:YVTN family beta-propeller protein